MKAKDATYSPPTLDNIAAKLKPPPVKKPEVMYRTSASIYDPLEQACYEEKAKTKRNGWES